MHVLVVEDDERVAGHVVKGLKGEGWLVDHVADGRQALFQVAAETYDVIVLDRMLPNVDGLKILQTMRASGDGTPVLILSALGDVDNRVKGLRAGGDDYLTKPFGIPELLARVRALLRRAGRGGDMPPVFAFGPVEVDLARRQVSRHGEAVHLTPIEYRLLSQLVANAGRVLTHRQLLREVWGPSHVEHAHYLRVYMAGLRRKLEDDPAMPRHILTESGVGYRLAV